MMNVVFDAVDQTVPIFSEQARDAGLVGLEGHRTRGGFRASLYNAVTVEDVMALTGFITGFERRYG